MPKGTLSGVCSEEFHTSDACVSGQYRLSTAKAVPQPKRAHPADEWLGQRGPVVSKCNLQRQKCMPTVSTTAWLMKSYVPSALCPVT